MNQADYCRAEAANLSKERVFSLAESVASHLEYDPCADMYELIARLGGKVKVEDTLLQDPERAGSLFVDGPDRFTVIIPSHTSPVRDRFTIAHELGHFVVHYLLTKDLSGATPPRMMALRKDSDRVEWEANWFAAAFLMPEHTFREKYQQLERNLNAVAEAFCVSRSAAKIRAKSLGL